MFPTTLKSFVHPGGVFRLEYPAHWDQVQKDEARSCGFGPHDRDDVGLWISIMPASLDTDHIKEHLAPMFKQALPAGETGEVRHDPTLKHYGLRADASKESASGC